MIVVDASIALAWCLGDEEDESAERALDRVVMEGAIAPAHWPLEVTNGLLAAERRGRLTAVDANRAARLLVELGIEIIPVEVGTAVHGVLESARSNGLTAYDACYLDLANHRDLPLATLDGDLRRACSDAGVELAT